MSLDVKSNSTDKRLDNLQVEYYDINVPEFKSPVRLIKVGRNAVIQCRSQLKDNTKPIAKGWLFHANVKDKSFWPAAEATNEGFMDLVNFDTVIRYQGNGYFSLENTSREIPASGYFYFNVPYITKE